MIILGIVGLVLLVGIGWFISTSNGINRIKVKIDEAQSAIEIQLKKRYDILTQSASIVKNYAAHEVDLFTSLRQCNSGMSAQDINEIAGEQEKAINKLFAIGEAYPELKSGNLYGNLQAQLSEENAQYAASKRAYNSNVTLLNNKVVSFPSSIICNMKGQGKMDFIKEITSDAEKAKLDNVDLGL